MVGPVLLGMWFFFTRLSQLLKRAVGTILRQNEDEWKFPMKISTTSPLEIILLPHFDRGSRQLLLSKTDTFESSTMVTAVTLVVPYQSLIGREIVCANLNTLRLL